MHATELLDRTIGPACQWMQKVRFEALKKATQAAMVARCMSVTGLGRAVEATCEKEGIKRMDRLIGNKLLQAEAVDVYRATAQRGATRRNAAQRGATRRNAAQRGATRRNAAQRGQVLPFALRAGAEAKRKT